jgi:hypothetical protein
MAIDLFSCSVRTGVAELHAAAADEFREREIKDRDLM